jgi:hypothetical protein
MRRIGLAGVVAVSLFAPLAAKAQPAQRRFALVFS